LRRQSQVWELKLRAFSERELVVTRCLGMPGACPRVLSSGRTTFHWRTFLSTLNKSVCVHTDSCECWNFGEIAL
jgi:hypothetical protein